MVEDQLYENPVMGIVTAITFTLIFAFMIFIVFLNTKQYIYYSRTEKRKNYVENMIFNGNLYENFVSDFIASDSNNVFIRISQPFRSGRKWFINIVFENLSEESVRMKVLPAVFEWNEHNIVAVPEYESVFVDSGDSFSMVQVAKRFSKIKPEVKVEMIDETGFHHVLTVEKV